MRCTINGRFHSEDLCITQSARKRTCALFNTLLRHIHSVSPKEAGGKFFKQWNSAVAQAVLHLVQCKWKSLVVVEQSAESTSSE